MFIKKTDFKSRTAVAPLEITAENKCGFCSNAKCCQYVTHPIDTPRSKADFDYMLWQVSHKSVSFYKDEDHWYMMISSPCTHIQKDGRCGIYAQRPQICREHSNDYCEFDAPAEDGWQMVFKNYESLLAYCRKRFCTWGR